MRRPCGFALLIGIALALLSGKATAQRFRFEHYTAADGLASSTVYAIDQDEQGYVWVATAEGLSRFDGREFLTFDHSSGLVTQRLRSMARTSDGRIWLGREQGLTVWDGYVVRNYGPADGLGSGTVRAIVFDAKGRAWIGRQTGGLSLFDRGRFRNFDEADGLPSSNVYALLADSRGRLWIGTRDRGIAVAEIDGDSPRVTGRWSDIADLGGSGVHALIEEPDGAILAAVRDAGIVRVDTQGVVTKLRTGIVGRNVYSFAFNRQGHLLVGTIDGGVSICTAPGYESCRQLDYENGLPAVNVTSVFEDREGHLWIGTESGLLRFGGHRFLTYTTSDGLPPDTILSLMPDGDDVIRIGSFAGLTSLRLATSRGGRVSVRTLTKADGLPSNSVWHTLRDADGRLWIATAEGLCLYTEGRGCRTFTRADGLPASQVIHLFQDSRGTIWVGTRGGVAKMSGTPESPRFETVAEAGAVTAGDCLAIDEGPDERVWFATTRGIASFDGREWHEWDTTADLDLPAITDLIVAGDSVWLATSGAGVVRVEPGPNDSLQTETFGLPSGLPSETVRTLVEADDGAIWAGTPAALVRLNPANRGSSAFVERIYTVEDGISSHEAVSPNGFAQGLSGDLWFGLIGGVTRYLPMRDLEPAVAPVVTVESVIVGGRRVFAAPFSTMVASTDENPLTRDEHATSGTRDVAIGYRAVAFLNRRELRYQVRLDDYDSDWSEPTSRTSKEYTKLPPGRYEFLVRSRLGNGHWSTPAVQAFEVPARFWETSWFRLLAILAALAAMIGAHRLRMLAVKRRNRELRKLVAERTSELEERSRELEHTNVELETINEIVMDADRAKSRFLANMSHELRTPLNSIIGFTDLLLGTGPRVAPEKHSKFLSNVRQSAQILLGLINDVLDISKIEAGKMEIHVEAVPLESLVDAAVDGLRGLAEPRGIRIETKVEGGLPLAWIDPTKVRQIVNNLLSNAVKFSAQGSVAEVHVRKADPGESGLEEDAFEIRVIDRGPGIPPEQIPGLFEEYRQAKAGARLGLGTGLGLAIVKNFALMQGGRVAVESVVGEGSTFRVWLPVDARRFDSERRVA